MSPIEFDTFTWPKKKGTNEDSVLVGSHVDIHYFGVALVVASRHKSQLCKPKLL
jgi:hypothetical protein